MGTGGGRVRGQRRGRADHRLLAPQSRPEDGGLTPVIAKIGTEYLLFGGAGLLSLIAFAALIMAPAVGSFGRTWEKATAMIVSLFVLVVLLALGVALGVAVVYYWDDITQLFG